MKAIIKRAFSVLAEYQKELYAFMFALVIIFTIVFSVGLSIGLGALLIFVVIFPFQLSLTFIAKLAGDYMPIEPRAFYYGYKMFPSSLVFGSKQSLKGFLIGLLCALGASLIMAGVIIKLTEILDPALFNALIEAVGSGNVEEVFDSIMKVDWVQELSIATYGVMGIVFLIFYALFGMNSGLGAYFCFSVPLTIDEGINLSRKVSKAHKKQSRAMNLICVLIFAIGAALGVTFYLLTYGSIFVNQYVCVILASFIASLIIAPLDVVYQLVRYQFVIEYGKQEMDNVVQKLNDEIKKAMEAKQNRKNENENGLK